MEFIFQYTTTGNFGARISVEIVNAISFYSVEMLESAQVGTGTYTNVLISMDREWRKKEKLDQENNFLREN